LCVILDSIQLLMYFFKCNCYQLKDEEKMPQNVTNGKRQIENGKWQIPEKF